MDGAARFVLLVEAAVFHRATDGGVEGATALFGDGQRETNGFEKNCADGSSDAGLCGKLHHFTLLLKARANIFDLLKPVEGAFDGLLNLRAAAANHADGDNGAHEGDAASVVAGGQQGLFSALGLEECGGNGVLEGVTAIAGAADDVNCGILTREDLAGKPGNPVARVSGLAARDDGLADTSVFDDNRSLNISVSGAAPAEE